MRHRCVMCRKLYEEGENDMSYGPDPYLDDVCHDPTPVWMCGPCSSERRADI